MFYATPTLRRVGFYKKPDLKSGNALQGFPHGCRF